MSGQAIKLVYLAKYGGITDILICTEEYHNDSHSILR